MTIKLVDQKCKAVCMVAGNFEKQKLAPRIINYDSGLVVSMTWTASIPIIATIATV